ncbi:MAG: serine/threonine protein kinase [Paenibacillus sp. RIFOXYA1_FULL_44_5]|nr:MAG: serine/threonine protein kinase [Paenibacillus sp. RIFOXYA1_FULL_44_5]
MGYIKYGLDPELVERVKWKMKNPVLKDRVKSALNGVTKYDLQDPAKVKALVLKLSNLAGERLSAQQTAQIVNFVLAQKIDPNNTFHLIKLWGMFR